MLGTTLINISIRIIAFAGVLLSYYAYVVETNLEEDSNYVAFCDISERISCSKAFMSEFGRGFGLVQYIAGDDSAYNQPNGVIGIFFYTIVMLLSFGESVSTSYVLLVLCTLSNFVSAYLAAVLYFVLYDACIVCIAMYIVNMMLFVLTYNRVKMPQLMRKMSQPKSQNAKKLK